MLPAEVIHNIAGSPLAGGPSVQPTDPSTVRPSVEAGSIIEAMANLTVIQTSPNP